MLHRRTFLLSSLVAPFIRPLQARAQENVDVVVIGAGLSGLNAAWILDQAGLNVRVLEGASRPGGRAMTAYDSEGDPELGASQIGPSYARVRDAIDQLGLELIPEHRPLMPFANYMDGRLIDQDEWADAPENKTAGDERAIPPVMMHDALLQKFNPLQELDDWLDPKFADYDVSLFDVFAKNNVSHAAMRLAKLTTGGMDLSIVSALTLFQEKTRGVFERDYYKNTVLAAHGDNPNPSPPTHNIKGGTSKLPEAMAQALSHEVSYNRIVTRIDMDASGADVYTHDGAKTRATFVISALPFTMLRRIHISPGLPTLHRDAVNTMPYLYTTRANVSIKEPYWEEDGLSPSLITDTISRMFWAIDKRPEDSTYKGQFVLMGQSAAAIDALPQEHVPQMLLDDLARIRPATKGKIEIQHYHSWANAPLIAGCRHSFAPGQVKRFARDMITPVDRLHFAGEHTRRLEYGMEAAMESGERAALEILERI